MTHCAFFVLGKNAIMASDEQFSLCWNNFHANMSAGFHGLLSRGDLVDVTLAAEGRLLQAHKLVLSVCSPYFQEMFKMNPTQHPIGKAQLLWKRVCLT